MNHVPALVIFLLTYLVIAIGKFPGLRLDRAGAAFAGAVAMVLSGALAPGQAERGIDFATIGLLFGMMIVVANLRLSGAFTAFARFLLLATRSGFGLLAMTIALAGVLAAFFINDVVCLALTPFLIEACEALGLEPVPFLIALATASNIGSAATITGNPQNMIVAGFAHLHYLRFAEHLVPIAAAGLIVDYAVIAMVYRRNLSSRKTLPKPLPRKPRHQLPWLIAKSAIVAMGTLICFALGFSTALVALAAGALLLFNRSLKPERVFRLIDWTLLLMFGGLFVVITGFQATGIPGELAKWIGVPALTNPVILAVVTGLLANIVSNVPAVLLFRPIFPMLGGSERTAMIISCVSTLAGNLTVVGSIANLIVIEQARTRDISVTFGEYLKAGVPVTILTIAIALAMLAAGI